MIAFQAVFHVEFIDPFQNDGDVVAPDLPDIVEVGSDAHGFGLEISEYRAGAAIATQLPETKPADPNGPGVAQELVKNEIDMKFIAALVLGVLVLVPHIPGMHLQ